MKIINTLQQRIDQARPFYSLEFFPPRDQEQWPAFFDVVEELTSLSPLFASVTYGAGGSTRDNTLELTARLAAAGLCPMAHLTCVGANKHSLRDYLARLQDAGVANILALRGDTPKGETIDWERCEFSYASDLVRFVRSTFPDMGIGVAAYPNAHPESPSFSADREATAAKIAAGSDFAVTQLFFDVRSYFEYVEQMRSLGVTAPILPGVLPVQSLESLRRILTLSGCHIPAALCLTLEEAFETGGPEAVREAGIAFAVAQIRSLLDGGAPGIHLYTLNKADMCLRIAQAVGPLC